VSSIRAALRIQNRLQHVLRPHASEHQLLVSESADAFHRAELELALHRSLVQVVDLAPAVQLVLAKLAFELRPGTLELLYFVLEVQVREAGVELLEELADVVRLGGFVRPGSREATSSLGWAAGVC
jgi:hypothetical protein